MTSHRSLGSAPGGGGCHFQCCCFKRCWFLAKGNIEPTPNQPKQNFTKKTHQIGRIYQQTNQQKHQIGQFKKSCSLETCSPKDHCLMNLLWDFTTPNHRKLFEVTVMTTVVLAKIISIPTTSTYGTCNKKTP